MLDVDIPYMELLEEDFYMTVLLSYDQKYLQNINGTSDFSQCSLLITTQLCWFNQAWYTSSNIIPLF